MAIDSTNQNEYQVKVPTFYSRLIELHLHPRRYFANASNLDDRTTLTFAIFLMGIASAISKIDEKIIQFELSLSQGGHNKGLEILVPWLLKSWVNYWIFAVFAGLVGSVALWFIGGWWYKKRLQWSGASDASPSKARGVYAIQQLVIAIPSVLLALILTSRFSSYSEAWQAAEIWPSAILIFSFWSCWVSYQAASTAFSTVRYKARIWFLILPVVLNLIALGVAIFGLMATKVT